MRLRRSKRRSSTTMTGIRGVPRALRRIGHRAIDRLRKGGASALAVVEQVPEAVDAARSGALDTGVMVQAMPKSTLQWLAAGSVGLGAGFFLSGAPRIVIAAGMTPAVIIGAAIVARQSDPGPAAHTGRRAGDR